MKTILVITDGIGHNPSDKFNAFAAAKKPNFDWLFKNAACSFLSTSGLAVGLPEGQMGNSEVGHMTIGAGRILYQNLVKIDKAIQDGSLAQNKDLQNLIKNSKRVHVIGLYSDGGVHSHLSHFDEICKISLKFGKKSLIHAITDGRDVKPTTGLEFISNLESKFEISTISGRFFAMDRDNRWDRVKVAYDTIFYGKNKQQISPKEYIKNSYEKGKTDEFVEPASFGDYGGVEAGDGIIFINYRNDRMREICSAFGSAKFDNFERKFVVENILTMTNYDDNFTFPVIFGKDEIKDTLSEVISRANLRQFHTAETEKYAHVTFFFNGGVENLVENETRVLIPSPKVATYDEKPEMSAFEVKDAVLKAMDDGQDFIVVNFANGDMVGHTGDMKASIKAVEAVDSCLGDIIKKAKELNYAYMQISDHGNCEAMQDKNGEILTNHTTFDVFCFVLCDGIKEIKSGGLSNVAPSVLKLMGLEIPSVMDEPLF